MIIYLELEHLKGEVLALTPGQQVIKRIRSFIMQKQMLFMFFTTSVGSGQHGMIVKFLLPELM